MTVPAESQLLAPDGYVCALAPFIRGLVTLTQSHPDDLHSHMGLLNRS